MTDGTLFVGTAGMSVWRSEDLGARWTRPYSESGLYLEARVWALSRHRDFADAVFAGTDQGLYRWSMAEESWQHLPSSMDGLCIWALAQDPRDGKRLLAGTHPAGLFLSEDAGETWTTFDVPFAESCIYIGKPRVTQVMFDPQDAAGLWASVEIDGIHYSPDNGKTWQRRHSGLISDDVHGFAFLEHYSPSSSGRRMLAATNQGLHISDDDGETWRLSELESPWQYTRTLMAVPGRPGHVYLTNGNGPPGSTGRLLYSADFGESWQDLGLPGALNSTPWCVALDETDSDTVFTVTNLGQAFLSRDAGASWSRLAREFGEVRSALWCAA